jgi:hypothetical protein
MFPAIGDTAGSKPAVEIVCRETDMGVVPVQFASGEAAVRHLAMPESRTLMMLNPMI